MKCVPCEEAGERIVFPYGFWIWHFFPLYFQDFFWYKFLSDNFWNNSLLFWFDGVSSQFLYFFETFFSVLNRRVYPKLVFFWRLFLLYSPNVFEYRHLLFANRTLHCLPFSTAYQTSSPKQRQLSILYLPIILRVHGFDCSNHFIWSLRKPWPRFSSNVYSDFSLKQ